MLRSAPRWAGSREESWAKQGDHRDQARRPGYYAVTRFPLSEPAFPPRQLAPNEPVGKVLFGRFEALASKN
jgi:hypothetical protein